MIKATGSQIIVKLLELEGIKIVAGIPGGSILPLYDELNRSTIRHVLVRQEQAAGFIAQGMTRSTGVPAVCMATSGPGAMNLLTAIADARCDSVPIIAITGQVNTALIGTDAFQEADTFGLSFPITKHSVMVKDARDLLTVIPEAFEISITGRPGPVLIDVPRDVQTAVVEFEKWPEVKKVSLANKSLIAKKEIAASKKQNAEKDVVAQTVTRVAKRFCTPLEEFPTIITAMAQTLLCAKKTVLYVGGGCNTPMAATEIAKFLQVYDCPVVQSLMGIGAVAYSYAHNMGMVGMHGSYVANRAMYDADVILAAGVRFDDRATGVIEKFCPNAKILHIDIDAAEINKILPAEISLVCDVESAFPLLTVRLNELSKKNVSKNESFRSKWTKELDKLKAETISIECGRPSKLKTVNPRAFIRDIPAAIKKAGVNPDNVIITTDVGQHQMWTAQYYPVEHPCQLLTSGSLGTMGFGLPTAIGASLANKKRVVCISGDGSILMNVQELATLAEVNTNVTVIVFQNGTLGMVKQQQQYLFKKNYSASVFEKQPDLLTVAKGFGIDAIDADKDGEWYLKAFTPGPHFVKISISPEENVLPYVSAGHANVDAMRE